MPSENVRDVLVDVRAAPRRGLQRIKSTCSGIDLDANLVQWRDHIGERSSPRNRGIVAAGQFTKMDRLDRTRLGLPIRRQHAELCSCDVAKPLAFAVVECCRILATPIEKQRTQTGMAGFFTDN